jgi:hypothetical protein
MKSKTLLDHIKPLQLQYDKADMILQEHLEYNPMVPDECYNPDNLDKGILVFNPRGRIDKDPNGERNYKNYKINCMKVDKYYTPEISEFCIGFEYESNGAGLAGSKDNWTKDKIENVINLQGIQFMLDSGCIRVKCLDQSDIESCGFLEVTKQDPYNNEKRNFIRYKDDVNIFTKDFKKMQISIPDVIRTKTPDGTHKRRVLFEGEIKNISVFKQVLKMIRVE